jgi:thiol-disulfide isomerase/thioredoxin
MKKVTYLLLITLILLNFTNTQAFNKIDGRSQALIDAENDIDIKYYLTSQRNSELFEIIDFKNISTGKNDNIKNYRGKIIILHFWATWCGYCIDEMKYLDQLSNILQKKEIDEIVIFPISIDNDNYSIIQDFYKESNIKNLSIYQDKENKYLSSLGKTTVPTTFIIGKDGKQIVVANGPVPWDNVSIINYLKKLL